MRMFPKTVVMAAVTLALVIGGCTLGDYGTVQLSVTDAPVVDAEDITGVYVTFEGVEYNVNGRWRQMTGFDGPKTINLLELTGEKSELLGSLNLVAGTYTQIRFMVAAEDEGAALPSNTGSWVNRDDNTTFDQGTDDPLFVPSGTQTGYKAVADAPFDVPANGTVAITADFDLRRAVVKASGFYILKPVIRLVVDDQAGTITGTVTNNTGKADYAFVVLAYEDGAYDVTETETASDGSQFPNAVTSSSVEDTDEDGDDDYTLAFLAAATYDIVVAQYNGSGDFVSASIVQENVEVTSDNVTTEPLTVE